VGFDEDLPWNFIIMTSAYGAAAATKAHWWETRVVLPMLQNASSARAAATTAILEGSLPPEALQPSGGRPRREKNRAGQRLGPAGAAQAAPTATGPGSKQVCWPWNRNADGCSSPCPNGRAHVCEFCGMANHRGVACRRKDGAKGKGKGSKGKSSS